MRPSGPLLALLLAPRAYSAVPDLSIDERPIVAPTPAYGGLFGVGVGGGDFDGDGYADLAVGSPPPNEVAIYPGSPTGIVVAEAWVLEPQIVGYRTGSAWYGSNLTTLDLDADGYDDLVVATANSDALFVYKGSPAGLVSASEQRIKRPLRNVHEGISYFGVSVSGGDTDGDGFDDLLAAEPLRQTALDGPQGAVWVFRGGEGELDPCAFIELDSVHEEPHTGLGDTTSGQGDVDGDGYADVVANCADCKGSAVAAVDRAVAYVWRGGPQGPSNGELAILDLAAQCNGQIPCLDVADIDGDGFGDIVAGSWDGGVFAYYGSPTGVDSASRTHLLGDGQTIATIGDLNGDGAQEVVSVAWDEDAWSGVGFLLFGSATRNEPAPSVALPAGDGRIYYGTPGLSGIGDADGDGRPEFAAGAPYEDHETGTGVTYLYSASCSWYLDADGDGHGDPADRVDVCRAIEGRVPHPNDCDDTDATVSGTLWYTDSDGDGFGAGEAILACAQPTGAVASRYDCDDTDPALNPDSTDAGVDGIDQDCDGRDGPWPEIDQDADWEYCPEDTGDSAATDSAADTASDDETSDTTGEEDSPPAEATSPCGCGAATGVAFPLLITLTAASRRRRAGGA